MENLLNNIQVSDIISIVLQVIVFCVFAFIMLKMVKLYFENIELKKEPEKNREQIKENFDKIKNIRVKFVKIGGIIFIVIFIILIVLSNFIEF